MKLTRILMAGALALALAACAAKPAPQGDLTPPQTRPFDAKTQLESGRTR